MHPIFKSDSVQEWIGKNKLTFSNKVVFQSKSKPLNGINVQLLLFIATLIMNRFF